MFGSTDESITVCCLDLMVGIVAEEKKDGLVLRPSSIASLCQISHSVTEDGDLNTMKLLMKRAERIQTVS